MLSDFIGPPLPMIPPSYGRGGPAPYVVPPHAGADMRVGGGGGVGFNGYPAIEHGRGFVAGGFTDRNGGGGGRGFGDRRGSDGGRGGGFVGRGRGGSFSGGRGGGRGGYDGGRGGRNRGDDLDNISLPKQDFGGLVPFKKDFYVESLSVRAMSEQEVMMYRAKRDITIEGHDVPKPIRIFQEANFPGIASF